MYIFKLMFLFSLDIYTQEWNCCIILQFCFQRNVHWFLQWLHQLILPSTVYKDSLSPYPCQHLLSVVFLVIVILTGVKKYLLVVLICISLISRKSRNTCSNRLIEFYQENTLVIANTLFQQHKRRLYTWTSPDDQHRTKIDYILCSQRWRNSIQSAKARPGADCGSDHELLIAKFRLKLKRVGITTRPFRYDLNQIPYEYAVEMRNRFKGLDLIDREPDELWTEVRDIVQETGIKTIPMEKKCKKAKWLFEEAL